MQLPLKVSWPLQKVVPFWGPPKTCRFQLAPEAGAASLVPAGAVGYRTLVAVQAQRVEDDTVFLPRWVWSFLARFLPLKIDDFFAPSFHSFSIFQFYATKTTKRPSLVDSGPGLPAPWQISLNLTRSTWIRNPQLASHLSWHSGPPSPGPRVVSEV